MTATGIAEVLSTGKSKHENKGLQHVERLRVTESSWVAGAAMKGWGDVFKVKSFPFLNQKMTSLRLRGPICIPQQIMQLLLKGQDDGTISLSEVISLDKAPLRLMPAGSSSDLCIHHKYSIKDKKASTQTIVSTTCVRLLLQRVKNTVCLIGRLSGGYRSSLSVAGSQSVLPYLRTLEIQTCRVLI